MTMLLRVITMTLVKKKTNKDNKNGKKNNNNKHDNVTKIN